MTGSFTDFLGQISGTIKPGEKKMDILADATLLDTPVAPGLTLRQHLVMLLQGTTATAVDDDEAVDILMQFKQQLPVVGSGLSRCGETGKDLDLFEGLLKQKTINHQGKQGVISLDMYAEILTLRRQWVLEHRPAPAPAGES